MFERKQLLLAALLVCGAFMRSAFAQAGPMRQSEDFRRQPPQPLAPRPFNLPKPFETSLANGLQIVIVEDHRLPYVSYRLALRTGSAHDPADLPGLANLLATMLTEGTEKRTSRQIAEEVARLGAELSVVANSDYTTVSAAGLSSYSDRVLDLMADIALHPAFPENELALVKQNAKQALIAQRAQPSFLANERLARVLFGEHPYSVISATPQSIDAVTREKLQQFHRARFIPNNAVLIVVGDVRREQVLKRINELFGSWARGEAGVANFPAPPVRRERAIYLVDRPGSQQSNIVIANLGITRTSPDYFPLLVMNTILGGNASSRLFMNLRERNGYTYGAYSNLDARRTAGSFRASAEVRTPVTGASLKEFFYELERIRNEAVSDEELKNAKTYLTGTFPIRLETQDGLIDQLVQIKMYDLPADYLQTYRERVVAVTKEDVQRVARQYVTPDKAAIIIVGDGKAIMEQIKPYAQTVEIYDSAGNLKGGAEALVGATTNAASATDIVGTWTINVMTPAGQALPVTLIIERNGEGLSGKISSQMGDAALKSVKLNGNGFEARSTFVLQGQEIELTINGRIEGDRLSGTISIPSYPDLNFNGTRAK
ncbi:MAG: insulinase family protein [Pyrinomonas methylaliphatogenes]|nr:insulinase family protein [Pyrinomonas methylaliphatogenes]